MCRCRYANRRFNQKLPDGSKVCVCARAVLCVDVGVGGGGCHATCACFPLSLTHSCFSLVVASPESLSFDHQAGFFLGDGAGAYFYFIALAV